MQTVRYPAKAEWSELLKRPLIDNSSLFGIVGGVLDEIKKDGDSSLRKYTEKFDKVVLDKIEVSETELNEAGANVAPELKAAIEKAAENVHQFHAAQKMQPLSVETCTGVSCWQKAVAIDKVGLYVPGGSAPLFSTVLMLGIPAKIAGCREIVLCTPPNKEGNVHPAILFAAKLVGITKVFKIGGVQAIGAMAYGTESVPKVFKIFGPGNQYVMAAKQLTSMADVAIDMPAGPSEVAVMADETSNPDFIASDLLSQAEHGPDSQVILVTSTESIIEGVIEALYKQLEVLPRKEIAEKAIANSRIILLKDEAEVIEMINEYAPEHLIISMKNYLEVADQITNAGSIFLGNYTPESAGDYASGTNHTLPTNGFATAYSGVNLDSFVKKITYQEISREGLKEIGPVIEIMAGAEELFAHKNAATVRLNSLKND